MKKMNFTFKSMLLSFVFLAMGLGAVSAQINIVRNWTAGAFANEPGWEIINIATQVVYNCAQAGTTTPNGAVTISVPAGFYEVRGFDSYGDTWNGGALTITQGGVTIFSTTGPPNGGYFPSGNTCDGDSFACQRGCLGDPGYF
ncbi:MAG: hypothetical protein IPL49_07725 [Saprospirales bacterium]|nr:hypothetical protein [Saprospirales bacterium]